MHILSQITDSAALLARQAASAATTSLTSAAATTATAAGSTFPTDTATAANATSTGSSGGNGGGGGNSPLLFFVALGFGVVFTNLWIIVGVKYCFRYNARARQLRQATENGEPINLGNMPRQHRRRREKKLMTIDEVNEKFPMIKYKSWVATRAKHGLSTLGGIDAPSRANSVRSVDGVVVQHKERESSDEPEESRKQDKVAFTAAKTSAVDDDALKHTDTVTPISLDSPVLEATSSVVLGSPAQAGTVSHSEEEAAHADDLVHDHDHHSDDEDDEHIDAALPPECIGTSGDTCAICIDTLENDDDVRGLTCGHAFHAVCLDPWLTSRRACCPLCKADYYTPKPRPSPQDIADGQATGIITVSIGGNGEVRRHRINLSSRPGTSWTTFWSASGRARQPEADANLQVLEVAPSRASMPGENDRLSRRGFFGRRRAATQSGSGEQSPDNQRPESTRSRRSWFGNARPSFPSIRDFTRRRSENNRLQGAASGNAAAAVAEVTPSQLEAGAQNESR
ncbi:ring finger domain protein [Grosmannia clavigera kw1407]|uniref:Ring finger domain protein n=1 Tax=Grosmannia clavigera (strain kw1407 / UAMH 11150) TaxID=655863 RepID=F0XAI4_GROCL|nr:ring finger domain protein [Grosmannia clavigera kw1407]EFX05386.1 ring finger domain protein [Grosmannia clavigera kw1407]